MMSTERQINRREFLKVSALAGAGLTIAICLPGCQSAPTPTEAPVPTPEPTQLPAPTASAEPTATAQAEVLFEPNIYLTIDNTGRVTIRAFRSEMGQGIRTAIATIVAEELDADWSTVRIEQSPTDSDYGDQVTGGSASVSNYYTILRQAGATVRHMLVTAAAQMWEIEMESCRTESGWVVHPDGNQRLAYADLVGAAAELPLPKRSEVQLKAPEDFSLIGSSMPLYDAPGMVDGSARYGSDLQVPGMLYATVARCPEFGGSVASFDASKAKSVAGVQDVVQIDRGIAVVAGNSWAAIQGRAALEVTWEQGSYADWSSASIRQQLVERAPAPDDTATEAAYDIPYLAHATMEPMTCLADVRADSCEVWAPSQAPQEAKQRARSITKLSADAITVHVPLLGGGFGRRHGTDFVEESVQISQAVGAPIKLVWTRDDDIQHDLYHPLSYTHVSASLDENGQPSRLPRVRSFPMTIGVPTGYWRSVENFTEAFARESFLDEVAAEKGLDPLELRLALLPERAQTVVELVAVQAEWGSTLSEGWGRGLAYWATFGVTHVAQVVEVSVSTDGEVRVHRVVCAVDCGTVINPDAVVAQMEGGIVFGLTAALKAEITIENGRVQQSNFHDYPLLRMDEMPIIEVHIVPSKERPSGIGEMGVPPIAPAVANAVYAATGKRIRRLPISAEALRA
jgi:isoquinoline 1-oxidoreductase beta subunit